jgi:hypothetical protein
VRHFYVPFLQFDVLFYSTITLIYLGSEHCAAMSLVTIELVGIV